MIWQKICTEDYEFLDLVDFGGVAFSVYYTRWVSSCIIKQKICTENCEFLDLVDFGGAAFSVDYKRWVSWCGTRWVSTENATPSTSTRSRNPQSSVQIWMIPKSQLESVPRDSEDSEFLELVGFGDVIFSVETVMMCTRYRVAKTHRIPYLYRSFPAKEPYH